MAVSTPRRSPLPEGDELQMRLESFLSCETGLPVGRVGVSGLARLAGGASRELWSLDLTLERGTGPERLELVLRRDPPGRSETDRGLEARVLRAAADAGVPVPEVHWGSNDPAVLGSPFFLMERLAGETLPRRLLRDAEYREAREGMVAELGVILAQIHALDPEPLGLAGVDTGPYGSGSAHRQIERMAAGLLQLAVEPHPVLDLAERWLLERAPEPDALRLVHGDYRIGNVMFGPEGVRAVLDWELAHWGDPVEDLGWLCVRAWRFGNDDRPAAGLGTRKELIAAYQSAGGQPVDPEALRFWEACGNFKLALVFVSQARAFLDGSRSVELASLGRRIAEAEMELLELID